MPKGLPVGKAGFQVVPLRDVVLGMFPAKENLAFIEQGRKVDQSPLKIFHLDFAAVKFPQN